MRGFTSNCTFPLPLPPIHTHIPPLPLHTHTCSHKSGVMGDNHTNITCTVVSPEVVECDGQEFHQQVFLTASEALFWIYLGVYIILVLFAGEESFRLAKPMNAVFTLTEMLRA